MSNDLLTIIKEKAQQWLSGNIDQETKKQVQYLLDHDQDELIESFYRDLEFGTGGLRGVMGPGINRINIYTIGMATQGLSNYLLKNFTENPQIKVAIAYDCRNNSKLFAEKTAQIFSANGIKVYLFKELRPTPELSFAIRELNCQSGVMITASHNPKEYNGYKVYWEHGGQIIAPHDKNIVTEVRNIASVDQIKFDGNPDLIEFIGEETDKIYLDKIKTLSLSPEIPKDIKIVFTAIHGTGNPLGPKILKEFGFSNVETVKEQDAPDGDFPTVHSPNPEEAAALDLAIEQAKRSNADLVFGTDPDGDRVGMAVRNDENKFILLNGNQIGSVLLYYLITKWKEAGKITGKEYIVKTIVTTELQAEMAKHYGVKCYNVLTGFKYIADVIEQKQGKEFFIGGGEESYGYLAGEFVRDKDAIISTALIAEAAAWGKSIGKSMYDLLIDIYIQHGFYKEDLVSITKKGKAGIEEIQQMMHDFRNNPPATLVGSKIIVVHDYKTQVTKNLISKKEEKIILPKSDVLQFLTEDGTKVSVRPSGTEPKIKFYFGVKTSIDNKADIKNATLVLDEKIERLKTEMGV